MKSLSLEKLQQDLAIEIGDEAVIAIVQNSLQPTLEIHPDFVLQISGFLSHNPSYYFDYLNCITCVDLGKMENKIRIIYNLTSIYYEYHIILHCNIPVPSLPTLPQIHSVSSVWKTADWHEREQYDLMGVFFIGHPDLRRILLPEDWVGNPLRKDYKPDESYHDIKILYE